MDARDDAGWDCTAQLWAVTWCRHVLCVLSCGSSFGVPTLSVLRRLIVVSPTTLHVKQVSRHCCKLCFRIKKGITSRIKCT
eukprot:3149946-Amphidinium_carterae.1